MPEVFDEIGESTWVCPKSGMYTVGVCGGGGGSGGGVYINGWDYAGGGAGGAGGSKTISVYLQKGDVLTITVGKGGTLLQGGEGTKVERKGALIAEAGGGGAGGSGYLENFYDPDFGTFYGGGPGGGGGGGGGSYASGEGGAIHDNYATGMGGTGGGSGAGTGGYASLDFYNGGSGVGSTGGTTAWSGGVGGTSTNFWGTSEQYGKGGNGNTGSGSPGNPGCVAITYTE